MHHVLKNPFSILPPTSLFKLLSHLPLVNLLISHVDSHDSSRTVDSAFLLDPSDAMDESFDETVD
jgi:hypothetical protein